MFSAAASQTDTTACSRTFSSVSWNRPSMRSENEFIVKLKCKQQRNEPTLLIQSHMTMAKRKRTIILKKKQLFNIGGKLQKRRGKKTKRMINSILLRSFFIFDYGPVYNGTKWKAFKWNRSKIGMNGHRYQTSIG